MGLNLCPPTSVKLKQSLSKHINIKNEFIKKQGILHEKITLTWEKVHLPWKGIIHYWRLLDPINESIGT